ncbi:MAG: hypothetical protein ACN4GW_11965 [Desulforhopalus sp.]
MSNTIYTATGCARCKITKSYMQENEYTYDEFDFKAEGKDAFNKFYRANRKDIFRDKDGVEFPVFTDGKVIRQGVSVIIGYLLAKDTLSGFIGRSQLHGEWIDGFNVSGGDPTHADELITVLSFLKKSGLKIQLTSNGENPQVLEKIVENGLGDRLVMEVSGPAELYPQIIGDQISAEDIGASLKLATRFSEYQFGTTIAPLVRIDDTVSYLTPEEVGNVAKMIEEATGSKKHPYKIRVCDLESLNDARLKGIEPLESPAMFKYRTAARRFMVMAEIEK